MASTKLMRRRKMARGHRATSHQVVKGRANLRRGGMSRIGSRGRQRKVRMPKSPSITRRPSL
jgi:hypothetical protein